MSLVAMGVSVRRDQADGAAVGSARSLSTVLGETGARYAGSASRARLPHTAYLEVTVRNAQGQISEVAGSGTRRTAGSAARRTVRGSCRVAHRLGPDAD